MIGHDCRNLQTPLVVWRPMGPAVATPARAATPLSGDPRGPVVRGATRVRRIALVAALVALVPVLISFVAMATRASNTALNIRAVEWLRENGASEIVAEVESIYYSLTAPSKGGPTLKSLPKLGYGGSGSNTAFRPPNIEPFIKPALPGEGVWRATRPSLEGEAPLLITTVRDQPEYPRVLAGVAWINTKKTHVAYYPGREEPAVELPSRGPMEVPNELRSGLLATFNSAFKLVDSGGGLVYHEHMYAPMRNGLATIVGYTDGHVDIISWSTGATVPAGVSFARQNLGLTVNEGKLARNIDNTGEWGATLGGAVLTWRSAAGITAHGDLLYASGEDQTAASLAKTLIRAGAVRAMTLDINPYWTSFITYGAAGGALPRNLLPNMERPATRYLEPDDRDFFAVFSK